jgi:hypothetical protein
VRHSSAVPCHSFDLGAGRALDPGSRLQCVAQPSLMVFFCGFRIAVGWAEDPDSSASRSSSGPVSIAPVPQPGLRSLSSHQPRQGCNAQVAECCERFGGRQQSSARCCAESRLLTSYPSLPRGESTEAPRRATVRGSSSPCSRSLWRDEPDEGAVMWHRTACRTWSGLVQAGRIPPRYWLPVSRTGVMRRCWWVGW